MKTIYDRVFGLTSLMDGGIHLRPVLGLRYYLGVQPPPVLRYYYWMATFPIVGLIWFVLFCLDIHELEYESATDESIDTIVILFRLFCVLIVVVEDIFNRQDLRNLLHSLKHIDDVISNLQVPIRHKVMLNYFSFHIFVVGLFIITIYEIFLTGLHWNAIVVCLCEHYYEAVGTSFSVLHVSILRVLGSQLQSLSELILKDDAMASKKAIFIHNR